jgi:hypothetical protein
MRPCWSVTSRFAVRGWSSASSQRSVIDGGQVSA